MSDLSLLQSDLQNYLLHDDDKIYQSIVSTDKVPAEVRLAIYANAYRSRLVEALAASFSALHSYLGSEQFEDVCLAYINRYPSPFRSIRWFGDKFAAFLAENYEYAWLAELAALEWTMATVFDAADSTVIDINVMQTIAPEKWADMRLTLHPSTQFLTLTWNVVQLWQTLSQDETPPEPQQLATPVPWIFWRKDLMTQYCSLTEDEAYAITTMLNGATFGELCEGLCQWHDEQQVAMRAASLLKGWISSGLITGINF